MKAEQNISKDIYFRRNNFWAFHQNLSYKMKLENFNVMILSQVTYVLNRVKAVHWRHTVQMLREESAWPSLPRTIMTPILFSLGLIPSLAPTKLELAKGKI